MNQIIQPHLLRYLKGKKLNDQVDAMESWLAAARSSAPHAILVINEQGIIAHPDNSRHQQFLKFFKELKKRNANIDGVGFQAHHPKKGLRRDPQTIWNILEDYAALDLSIEITEWDATWSKGDAQAQQEQAEYLEETITMLYSHPQAKSFVMWGMWDGHNWKENGPLFFKDWSPKPGLAVWKRLVLGEWWDQ